MSKWFISIGSMLPAVLRPGATEIVIKMIETAGFKVAGLPIHGLARDERTFEHFEGPWIGMRPENCHHVYERRPDLIHRLAFPAAEACWRWTEQQRAAGGHWSRHDIPESLQLHPQETVELHPGLGTGQQVHGLLGRLAEANNRASVCALDTYHARRNSWRKQGPWYCRVAPYVGAIHLQPDRGNPHGFLEDLQTGATSNTLLAVRQLYKAGVQAPVIVEVSALDCIKPNFGWPTITSPNRLTEIVIDYANTAREKIARG
jgi:hypothetical protein